MKRITIRAPQKIVDRLELAAQALGMPLSQFVIHAATEKANAVVARDTQLEYSLEDAKLFCAMLDADANINDRLREAFRHRRFGEVNA